MNLKNKKAFFEFSIFDEYIAGIILTGPEVKSIRKGSIAFNDSYCTFITDNELVVRHLHISEYKNGTTYITQDPKRDKKLLLKKKELRKLKRAIEEKGFTIVPTYIFIDTRGYIKIKIALAKGKKQYDKRETIKKRDLERYGE